MGYYSLNSALDDWLLSKYMTTDNFCKRLGISRTSVWKIKKNQTVNLETSNKVKEFTNGDIVPITGKRLK